MTHDELLYMTDLRILASPQTKALHAVIKLHNPILRMIEVDETQAGLVAKMKHICELDENYYPCPTIKAIKKELTNINKRRK